MADWKLLADEPPPVGTKFVALYDDGSGARMFWRHDGGFIECDGDEVKSLDGLYDKWIELPQDTEFWCEIGSEPMVLRIPQESDNG